jgi:hypothetical protein
MLESFFSYLDACQNIFVIEKNTRTGGQTSAIPLTIHVSAVRATINHYEQQADSRDREIPQGEIDISTAPPNLTPWLTRIADATTPAAVVSIVKEFCQHPSTPSERRIIDQAANAKVPGGLWAYNTKTDAQIEQEVRAWDRELSRQISANPPSEISKAIAHRLPIGKVTTKAVEAIIEDLRKE